MKPPGSISLIVLTIIVLGCTLALGEPYEVSYEGDVFPEEVGWERFTSGWGAERSVAGGDLALTSDDPLVADQYKLDRQGALDAGPGEFFYAEWRMRLLPGSGIVDVNVSIDRDAEQGGIDFGFSTDHITSFRDDNRIDPKPPKSLPEGLEETLTLHRLGVPEALRKSVRSANLIERAISMARDGFGRGHSWRGQDMRLRWTATGMLQAEQRFRQLRACKWMSQFSAALDSYHPAVAACEQAA